MFLSNLKYFFLFQFFLFTIQISKTNRCTALYTSFMLVHALVHCSFLPHWIIFCLFELGKCIFQKRKTEFQNAKSELWNRKSPIHNSICPSPKYKECNSFELFRLALNSFAFFLLKMVIFPIGSIQNYFPNGKIPD